MLTPVRVSGPAMSVVPVGEAIEFARVPTDDAALMEGLVVSAIEHFDGYSGTLGRCLINQSWRIGLGAWPADGVIRLPFPDVSAATVKYSDADDAEQTVNAGLVELGADELGSFVRLRDAFTAPTLYDDRLDAVRVTFTAGYGAAAADVPKPIHVAIKLLAAHWYEHREAAGEAMQSIPFGVDMLISPYRRVGV